MDGSSPIFRLIKGLLSIYYYLWLVDRPGWCSPEKNCWLVKTGVLITCVEVIFRVKVKSVMRLCYVS